MPVAVVWYLPLWWATVVVGADDDTREGGRWQREQTEASIAHRGAQTPKLKRGKATSP